MRKPLRRHSKVSKAQLAADRKNLAKGRTAAARHRAQSGSSPAQKAAVKKAGAAGRAAQSQIRRFEKLGMPAGRAKAAEQASRARKLTPDGVGCCSAEALAASLRLTGVAVCEEDVLALHWRTAAGPDDGVLIGVSLEAAALCGLAGWYPVFRQADAGDIVPGMILGFDSWWGIAPHAVAAAPGGVISWREHYLLPGLPDEAWAVGWGR